MLKKVLTQVLASFMRLYLFVINFYIPICAFIYLVALLAYMLFKPGKTTKIDEHTIQQTLFWVNYYWTLNSFAIIMAFSAAFKKNKNNLDLIVIRFMLFQRIILTVYYTLGLIFFHPYLSANDAVPYTFIVAGILALPLQAYYQMKSIDK